MIDYKNSLNLPKTNFPMRGNLTKLEPKILQRWYKYNLYEKIRNKKYGKKIFYLNDGPPYANGNIHIGHSVNKILKDIIIKSKSLMGYDSPYIPGWDCHGLPIEMKVEIFFGKPGIKISKLEFRIICRHYANEQIIKQKKDFIRLGVIGDWNNPNISMDFSTEANIIRILKKIIYKKQIYKGIKPVPWCINCCSSLAEAELEYIKKTTKSIYIEFNAIDNLKLKNIFNVKNFQGKISIIIWTTNPWTLPANCAIAINPELNYKLIKFNNKGYIIEKTLVKKIMTYINIKNWEVLGNVIGKKLNLIKFKHPFMNYSVPIVLSNHVSIETGTGAVHIAPCYGIDDYIIGKKYNLNINNIIEPNGYYKIGTFPILDGMHIFNANKFLLNFMKIIHIEIINHSYPHCWRHKTPIIFLTTPQWFISMDYNNLRNKILAEIKKVKWIPEWGKEHIKNMVNTRPDWCISRQRTWGVPIPLFVHKKTNHLHPKTIELIEKIAKQIEKKGIQIWWNLKSNNILGKDSLLYEKVLDTLDVWFDSGTNFLNIKKKYSILNNYKSDIYIEGIDQYRGWFMSSLIISTIIKNEAPYKKVLTHGFAVDSNGKKMSKSLGNIISPQNIIKKLGADILRLWVASNNYTGEITISKEILNRAVDYYRRIRNTFRFMLGNLYEFNPKKHIINKNNMVKLDLWIINRAYSIQKKIIYYYEKYDFHNVLNIIINFCSIELSSFYLDIIKDRQYTIKSDSIARRSCQTSLYHITEALVRWISPIISFTADEIWNFIPGKRSKFIFTEIWYKKLFKLDKTEKFNNNYWNFMFKIRNEINKIIELSRKNKLINSSLEAKIILYAKSYIIDKLNIIGKELSFFFIISDIKIKKYNYADINSVKSKNIKGLKILLNKATGKKCKRCWNYKKDIGQNIKYNKICKRCINNITGIGEKRKFI